MLDGSFHVHIGTFGYVLPECLIVSLCFGFFHGPII
jgi:hypothetical protein